MTVTKQNNTLHIFFKYLVDFYESETTDGTVQCVCTYKVSDKKLLLLFYFL
jgi:hypothetical protein